jgi:hypothetical protein
MSEAKKDLRLFFVASGLAAIRQLQGVRQHW